MPSLLSYLITGVLALFASWAFSGCRLGNNVEKKEEALPYSYYGMQPKHLFVCVKMKNQDDGNCSETTLDKITEWTIYLTDPIVFYQPDKGEKVAYLVSKDLKRMLPIALNSASSSSFVHYSYTSPLALFHHTECVDQMVNYGEGTYHTSGSAGKSVEGKPLSGRVEFVFQTERAITGSCDATLQEMQACYLDTSEDKTDCGLDTPEKNRAEHDWAVRYFEPYIDRGLMTPNDIPNVAKVYYQFIYE